MTAFLRLAAARIFLVLLLAACSTALVGAQHAIPETTSQAAARAAAIVTARVVDVRVVDEGWIYTYVDCETTETVKGTVPARFSYRIFGGRIGSREVNAGDDKQTFRKGDELVLFMTQAPNPYPIVIEPHIYKIVSRSGVRMVTPTPGALDTAGASADARSADSARLDNFLSALRRQR